MAKNEKVERFYAPCEKCKRRTRHEVIVESGDHGSDDYNYFMGHAVIQCLGCEEKSFRRIFKDFESAYPISNDEWEIPEEVQFYPRFDHVYEELEDIDKVPNLVRDIYKESLAAMQEGALTLSGLGLRGTIEAVCNDQNITGRSLESRITKLATQGLISNKDASRLHAIRFLGNDAAHDIKRPKKDQLSVALKIINHLIQSVYLLELEVTGKLDTIVTDHDEFKKLLKNHLKSYNSGDEYPLAKFLGKDIRRLGAGASQLEVQLMADIISGGFTELSVGKVASFAGKPNLQHFIVI